MKARPLVQRGRVALVTVGALAEAGDDAARLGVDCDLAAVDETRALTELAPQP